MTRDELEARIDECKRALPEVVVECEDGTRLPALLTRSEDPAQAKVVVRVHGSFFPAGLWPWDTVVRGRPLKA